MSTTDGKHTLLFIDDETDNLDALERVFRKKYHILKCDSAPKALALLKTHPEISVIVSDQRMPDMTGVEFFAKSMKTHASSIRILLTGYTDLDSVVAAINSGQVYRYITKPWDTRDLQITIDQAVEKFELESELRLKNIALENALTELKTLDQAKSQFMILINHELKTPLTSLISFLELLTQTDLDDDQKKYSDRIQRSADRLNEIIVDSLELVSSELGQTKIQKGKIQDQKLIDQVLKRNLTFIEAKNATIKVKTADIKIETDPQMLENILTRILKNAVQHGEPGEDILIETKELDNGVQFEITNYGKDISKETIEKILKPFALNENIMNHSKGLGLGLSISQSLLKRLDSTLEIKSAKKQITVSFVIP